MGEKEKDRQKGDNERGISYNIIVNTHIDFGKMAIVMKQNKTTTTTKVIVNI